jgi:hypothetical protein
MDKFQENKIVSIQMYVVAVCCPVQALSTGKKMGHVGLSVVIPYASMSND